MKYKNLKSVPVTLKASVGKDLKFINEWQSYYDIEIEKGRTEASATRMAWLKFKLKYKLINQEWVLK